MSPKPSTAGHDATGEPRGGLRWWVVASALALGLVALALAMASAQDRKGASGKTTNAPPALAPAATALALPKLVPLASGRPPPPAVLAFREPAAAASATPPPAPVKSLFLEPMPELLAKAHEFVQGGKPMRAHKTKEVYDYGMANPRDARPWLILAADDHSRGWEGFAVKHYRMAFEADPRAADEPGVAKNLARVAGDPRHGEEAKAVIRAMYGARARERMEAQLEEAVRSGDADAIAAIERLVGEL